MQQISRHQCLIYEGPPTAHLQSIVSLIRQRLDENYRCLYLNSPPMVAGLRSYLFAGGVDVPKEVMKGSLVLSSDQGHLHGRGFDVNRMLDILNEAAVQATKEGYDGIWATGDMTWEFGPEKDFSKLLEYEWGLEELFSRQPSLSGICQYHTDTLPPEIVKHGLLSHQTIFINETLSRLNPHYTPRESFNGHAKDKGIDDMLQCL